MSKTYNVAVVGATGLVGEQILSTLHQRNFPIDNIYAIASAKSEKQQIKFGSTKLEVHDLDKFDFSGIDFAFFSAGKAVSEQYAPQAAANGALVIDNTSAFRYQAEIPLVVPEVNPTALSSKIVGNGGIIANPNCTTIQILLAISPLHNLVGIKSVNIATYQAVSGTGRKGITELVGQCGELLNGRSVTSKVYPKQIAFNVLPHIGDFQDNGYSYEEMKIVWEIQKILNEPDLRVNPTAARVPVLYGHSAAISLETCYPLELAEVHSCLQQAAGISIPEQQQLQNYPTAFTDALGSDLVFIGRLRKDLYNPNIINMWVVADNIRKGAALNSIQIAEECIKN